MMDETQELLNKKAIELIDTRNELAVAYKNLDTACKISENRLDTIVELNNRINKAIEYIEEFNNGLQYTKKQIGMNEAKLQIATTLLEDLLDILKGEK